MQTNAIEHVLVQGSPAYRLRFTLDYAEAYDAFYALADKFGKRTRTITIAVIAAVVLTLLFLQYRNPLALYYTVVAGWGILLLFWLIYAPSLKARRGAKTVNRAGGQFAFTLSKQGCILMENAGDQVISLAGDKSSRIIETEKLFILRPDSNHSFCIPKRILPPSQQAQVRELLREQVACYQQR